YGCRGTPAACPGHGSAMPLQVSGFLKPFLNFYIRAVTANYFHKGRVFIMSKSDDGYRRGLAAGKAVGDRVGPAWTENLMEWARTAYPASTHLDYWDEVLKLDRERMESVPSAARYPELQGLPDELRAERQGFMEGCGGGPREVAFHYTWFYFISRRLNTRYVGFNQRANHCTAVYIRDSKEGGPLQGRNLDDVRRPPALEKLDPPRRGPDGKRRLITGGVSSAVLCDEEPTEIFPVDPWQIMPADCKQVGDIVDFLTRYVEFWGPQNGIIVDEEQNAVAFEKSNCRLGVRRSTDGTAAVTACSYLIPEMKKFKAERSRLSLKLRGWDETSPDWVYWTGCDARYERLLKLTAEANQRGATLEDMANIVTDHAVPFPERICLAGERSHRDDADVNWTLISSASVLEGPHRRTLFYRVEGSTPCYNSPPFLVPGPGVEMKREWKKGTRSAS
ncbi:MAG TPA: hypothetical protein VNA16_03270, partial [Abditibacteriaceae bacterium]|nr:hypothetical protein [Abditibacteriaceae bacterium]